MKKKIWKCKAYKNTKVDYIKSQVQIGKLLEGNGIYEKQFTDSLSEGKSQIIFIKELEFEGKKIKMGVSIRLPDVNEKNRNQLYRALFYYLKAKFESLTFGFVEEYNEAFVKEFMPYLITDKMGRTVADLILPKFGMALKYSKNGEQLYLEDKDDEKEDWKQMIELTTAGWIINRTYLIKYDWKIKGRQMKQDYNEEDDNKSGGVLCVMIKCKCGESILCMFGTNKNGDLIDHDGCKLKAKNKEVENKWKIRYLN